MQATAGGGSSETLPPATAQELSTLQRAITWERSQGLQDSQGQRQRFSEYAALALDGLNSSQAGSLVQDYRDYWLLAIPERQELLARTERFAQNMLQEHRGEQAAEGAANSFASTGQAHPASSPAALQRQQYAQQPVAPAPAQDERRRRLQAQQEAPLRQEQVASKWPAAASPLLQDPLVPQDGGGAVASSNVAAPEATGNEPAPEDFVVVNGRKMKASTARMRDSFAAAAAKAAGEDSGRQGSMASGDQRTAEWFKLRENRLTASAFCNALGFFNDGRVRIWEEKLGLQPKFAGNAATVWGTRHEDFALSRYEQVTGYQVEACRFQVMRDDDVHGWLGASPDGLISSLTTSTGNENEDFGPGVLEIKCPFNRGRPEVARPPDQPQWYYMPQMQGLMDIFDREWCDAFIWTPNGSGLFRLQRDRAYWAACYEVLAEFWWGHVVPAKHALADFDATAAAAATGLQPQQFDGSTGSSIDGSSSLTAQAAADAAAQDAARVAAGIVFDGGDAMLDANSERAAIVAEYCPEVDHAMTDSLRATSKAMAAAAPKRFYPPA